MRNLSAQQAARCERAKTPRCRCRCGGTRHGAQRELFSVFDVDAHAVAFARVPVVEDEGAPAAEGE